MIVKVVWMFLLQGLLVVTYPTGHEGNEMINTRLVDSALSKNTSEFSDTVPSESSTALEKVEEPRILLPMTKANDDSGSLKDTIVSESATVDAELTGNQEKIERKPTQTDKMLDTELEIMDTATKAVLKHEMIPNMKITANSDLEKMDSKIAATVTMIEPELERTESTAKSLVENNTNAVILGLEEKEEQVDVTSKVSAASRTTHRETEVDMPKIQSFVDSELAKVDSFIESELVKVDSFVECKLAEAEVLLMSEVSKADTLVEAELVKTEASVKLKMDEIEATVDSKLATSEIPIQSVEKFDEMVSDKGSALRSKEFTPDNAKNEEIVVPETKVEVPVTGNADFCGTVPVSGRTLILGHTGPLQPVLPPLEMASDANTFELFTELQKNNVADTTEQSQLLVSTVEENNNFESLTETAVLGSILADAFLAGKEVEIETLLAEIDAFVETELKKVDTLVNTGLVVIPDANPSLHSDLEKMESRVKSTITSIDDKVELALRKTEDLVKSAVDNNTKVVLSELAKLKTQIDLDNTKLDVPISSKLTETEYYKELDMEKIKSFLDFELAKVDVFIEAELAKIDSFVESELEKVETLIRSETAKVDSSVEGKLAQIESLVKSKLDKVEATSEVLAQGVPEFIEMIPDTGNHLIDSTDYTSVYVNNMEDDIMLEPKTEVPIAGNVEFYGTAPATGKTLIFGHTGPLHPKLDSLEIAPVADTLDTCEQNSKSGETSFNKVDHVTFPQKVNSNAVDEAIADNMESPNEGTQAVVKGNIEFSGTTRATGRTRIFAHFGCAPLLPTEETSDGKKFIWIAKKPNNNATPLQPNALQTEGNSPNFSTASIPISAYSADFPETIINDSTKNYERFIDDYEITDDNVEHVPVIGEATFNGIVPAYGSVHITGHTC